MGENKVKIEVSKLTLVFIILFGLCIIIWSFIIGIWVGTKIGVKEENIALEEKGKSLEIPSPVAPVAPSSNKTEVGKAPIFLPSQPSAKISKSSTHAHKMVTSKKVKKKISVSSRKEVKETEQPSSKYTKKEVAYIASQIKNKSFCYAIQIGAFSNKKSAEKMKKLAENKGYKTVIKSAKINGKVFYKVFVGEYLSKNEAKKYISEVSKDLGVNKPFVVKIEKW
ncbi:SPOR domain-containing protein [Thermodesulfobacterium hydrogeniphilum]|uniref:SPOR domain-containing protein n=1 Tax=Thermodesulfobacterium hydrogeniphilum TaxID=161156 RepID=UPI00056F761A|nr:SPOR domain-containing protein [Thermodesulfobacterium hydrogeniphilum]